MHKIMLPAATIALVAGGMGVAHAIPACVHEDGSGQGLCLWNAQTQGNGQGTSVVNNWDEQATEAWLMFDAAGAGSLVPAGHAVEYTAHSWEPFVLGANHIQVTDYAGNHWLFTHYPYGG